MCLSRPSMKKIQLKNIFLPIFIIVCGVVSPAYAGDTPDTFAEIIKSWALTLGHLSSFFLFISGLTGVILVIVGLLKLKSGQNQQTQQGGSRVGFLYLIFGSCLLSVDIFALTLNNSINGGTQSPITPVLPPIPTTIYDAIIVYVLIPFMHLITYVGPVIGIGIIALALHRFRYHSNPQIMSMHRRSPLASSFYLFVGAVFMCPDYVVQALSGSLFQTPQLLDRLCPSTTGSAFLSYFDNLNSNNGASCKSSKCSSLKSPW